MCGDKVHIFAKLDKNKNVEDISFEGEGCAISLASASILTEIIKGKEKNVAKFIIEEFLKLLKKEGDIRLNSLNDDQLTTIMSLSGVREFPMRVKCATMAWHTLSSVIEKKGLNDFKRKNYIRD